MKLFLDDMRPAPDGWLLVSSVSEALVWLETETVTHLSLDHDLGNDSGETGYDVLVWIENACYFQESYKPPKILIHSANPVGRKRMNQALKSIKTILRKRPTS